jgi:hypothetical protein
MGRYYSGDIEGKFWFGVQDSTDASFFTDREDEIIEDLYPSGEDEDRDPDEEPWGVIYRFEKEDLESVQEGIKACKEKLGTKKVLLDDFFAREQGYNEAKLAKDIGCPEGEIHGLLVWYARLELGEKIRWCLETKGECTFDCEY